jgi:hypothetical protein
MTRRAAFSALATVMVGQSHVGQTLDLRLLKPDPHLRLVFGAVERVTVSRGDKSATFTVDEMIDALNQKGER